MGAQRPSPWKIRTRWASWMEESGVNWFPGDAMERVTGKRA